MTSSNCVVRNRNGDVIQTSRNLAGIRRYVAKHLISQLDVSKDVNGGGSGQLSILFDDGSSYQTKFADYSVLLDFVSRWRNVYGAPLLIGGRQSGLVHATSFKNEFRNEYPKVNVQS